jgi:hypothetical protein
MSSSGNMVRCRRSSVLRRGSIAGANSHYGRKMSIVIPQEDCELMHLAPSIQRFWKVTQMFVNTYNCMRPSQSNLFYTADFPDTSLLQLARTKEGDFTGENLSPRSQRLMNLLPKPKTSQAMVLVNLERVKTQVANGMDHVRKVQFLSSSFIREYFERIPPVQVVSQ